MLKKIEKTPFGLRKKWKKFDFRFLNGTKFRTNIFSLGGGSGWVGLKSPCGFLLKNGLNFFTCRQSLFLLIHVICTVK